MKTTLEWVSIKDKLPEDNRDLLINIQGRYYEDAKFIDNIFHSNTRLINARKYRYGKTSGYTADDTGLNITHWAYVNLPEEEEMFEVICDECNKLIGKTKSKYVTQDFKDLCKECKEKEEKVMKEADWIWPLKQLPEKGQRVEVLTFYEDEVLCEWNGNHFFPDDDIESCVDDVIAWRPLKEKDIGNKDDLWIHVNEKLPGLGSKVEILWIDGKIKNACFTVSDIGKQDLCFCGLEDSVYFRIPDYWRPLKDGAHNAACGSCKKHLCECSKNDISAWRPLRGEARKFENGNTLKNKVTGDVTIFYDGVWYNLDKVFQDGVNKNKKNEKQEPEERKPDFSKLKREDLIVFNRETCPYVGFFVEISDNYLVYSKWKGERMDDCICSLNEIKKIIRINIGEPCFYDSDVKDSRCCGNFTFEEI